MIHRLAPELLEAMLQELIDHRLHLTDLPEPVLAVAGVRSRSLRQQMSSHRVGVRKSSAPRRAVT